MRGGDDLECRKAACADRLQKVVSRGIQPRNLHIVGVVGVVGTDSRVCVPDDSG